MPSLFRNPDDHRLRALWRLLAVPALTMAGVWALTPPMHGLLGPPLGLRFALLGGFTGAVWLGGRYLDRRPFRAFGFHRDRRWWPDFGFGLGLGMLLMAGLFGMEYALGWVTVTATYQAADAFGPSLFVAFVSFACVGFYEELLFRGYLVRNLAEGFHGPRLDAHRAVIAAWGVSSVLFGVAHALNPNASPVSTLNIAGAGLFLGLGYVLTGELALPIGLHIAWNFAQGNVFGFPVSGGSDFAAQVLVIRQGGPDVWTGGAFGPEAGLLGLAAMAVGSLLTLWWVRRSHGRLHWHAALAEAPPPA